MKFIKVNCYKLRVSKTSIKRNLSFILGLLENQKIINKTNYSVLFLSDDFLSNTIQKENLFEKSNIYGITQESINELIEKSKQFVDAKPIIIENTAPYAFESDCKPQITINHLLFVVLPENFKSFTFAQRQLLKKLHSDLKILITLTPESKKLKKINSFTNNFQKGYFDLEQY